MTTTNPQADPTALIAGLVPEGETALTEIVALAQNQGLLPAATLDAIQILRRQGVLSFDGKTVTRPARPGMDARRPAGRRGLDARDDKNWF